MSPPATRKWSFLLIPAGKKNCLCFDQRTSNGYARKPRIDASLSMCWRNEVRTEFYVCKTLVLYSYQQYSNDFPAEEIMKLSDIVFTQ